MALNIISLRSSFSGYIQLMANRRDVVTESVNRHGEILRKVDSVVAKCGSSSARHSIY
jgi:hypothetical protein